MVEAGAGRRRRRRWPRRRRSADLAGHAAGERAACLMRAADLLEARMPHLLGLIVREAGKTLPNAVGEVREAVDFLRYYAAGDRGRCSNDTHRPLGPVACISPWNFPLAIFTGQVAAALAAGNAGAGQAGRGNAADRRARRCSCCTRPACRRMRCSCCPATATVGARAGRRSAHCAA